MSMRTIEQILRDRQRRLPGVGRLVAELDARQSLTDQLRAVLREEEAAHYAVARLDGALLVVLARSASWATRFRFRVPELLPRLRRLKDFAAVEEIRVRTAATAPGDG
ncbi:MAG: DUF721 domain-containing protein [Gammaproteobacteria bacterium]|nr:DUF721 domain-containing protein [Gammaproteobacteria bacterium]MYE84550.1 DUF721 domain-containing protein [Gammaproteobacteria bacterium]